MSLPSVSRAEGGRRLASLRERCQSLVLLASVGHQVRAYLLERGSEVWPPEDELGWRSWIERQGDDEARGMLAAIDEEVQKRCQQMEKARRT